MINPFAFQELLELSGGFFMGERSHWREPQGVCIDSRDACEKSLFVPLKGERTDGHLHIENALKSGASAVLVERSWAESHFETLRDWSGRYEVLFFIVDDPLKQMQRMAVRHRQRFPDMKVAAVTGSNGKTTTKEMVAAILATMGTCYKNPGNLNSEIGLPLTMLRMGKEHEYAVFELGINHIGEMDILVDIARPEYALITNIGTAHIGYLGSKRKIAEEKRKIFSLLPEDGVAIVAENESFSDVLSENLHSPLSYFGKKSLPELKSIENLGLEGQKLMFTDCTVLLSLPGVHNLSNALAAISLTRAMGADWGHIKEGLESLDAVFGRSEVLKGRVNILQDCYNANPDSVLAGVKMLNSLPSSGRKILVLGDMLELGEESRHSHESVAKALAQSGVDEFFLFGTEVKAAADELEKTGQLMICTDDYQTLEKKLLDSVQPGDLILLKGSRGMELERLTEPLMRGA